MSFQVRDMTYLDLPSILRIERDSFPSPWSTAMFVMEMTRAGSQCFVVEGEEGSCLGYLVSSRLDLEWHLMNIAVKRESRRSGVAELLMQSLISAIGETARVTLEVRPSNAAGISLYERWGFLAAGRRKSYYADTGEDALIMWRTEETLKGSLAGIPDAEVQGT